MSATERREAQVAVIGAGLAGLTAARRLEREGVSVVVVEARERVGGRLLNEDIGDGKVVEVGGQWVGPTQDRVLALIAELGLETFPTYGEGSNLLEWNGRLSRFTGTIPKLNPIALLDVEQAMRRLDRLARRIPPDAPWQAPRAARYDSLTAADWMRRNMASRAGRTLMEIAVESVWAAEPEDISLLHMLFYIRSAGSLSLLFDTEGGAQQDRVVGGTQLIALRLAEELGDRVMLNAPVRRIERGGGGVTINADGQVVQARRAIVALAPALAGRLGYDPPLPGFRDQLTQRMPLGTVAKCMAIYDEPFWRSDGLSGQAISDAGPVRLTFDNSPPDGRPGVLLGFLEGRFARELGRLSPAERRTIVLECFGRLFGPRAKEPDAYVERHWADEEFSRGCYGCYLPPGTWTSYGPALRPPIGPLHWAGSEYASVWSGYMDGAVSSGERAAREVLEAGV